MDSDTMLFWVILLFTSSVSGVVSALIINGKTKEGGTIAIYFFLGAVLGIFGVLLALAYQSVDYIKCPYCAESIKKEAAVCKHCDRKLKGLTLDNLPSR